jgi:hypothetical protein
VGRLYLLVTIMKEFGTVKIPTPEIKDDGKVRMGMVSPAFPPVHTEPANVADSGKVRIGMVSPAFPPAH